MYIYIYIYIYIYVIMYIYIYIYIYITRIGRIIQSRVSKLLNISNNNKIFHTTIISL